MHLLPDDPLDAALVAEVHPADWSNPRPAGRYNLVAVGGGTAGLIAAVGAARLGGRAALVERRLLGGDCLNYGCVPSKTLLRAARVAYQALHAGGYGCRLAHPPEVDFPAVMERMRRLRAQLSRHDSARRLAGLGIDVFFGEARFVSPEAIEVDGQTLRFHRAVIATGARPILPRLEGLDEVGVLTNETIFSLVELPRRLVVLGAGPVGCELAQAFRRFGSEVHLVDAAERILGKEDRSAAELVRGQLEREGIALHLGWQAQRLSRAEGVRELVIHRQGEVRRLAADAILVAVGRRPQLDGLGLEAARVRRDERGLVLNDFLQTSNPRIYAAGDAGSSYQFTHAADALARLALRNALFPGRTRATKLIIPRTTYTDPELAHVGLTPEEARRRGVAIESFRCRLSEVDRAVLDGQTAGLAVVHVRRGSDRVVGATLVSAHAGESIGEVVLLMTGKLGLGTLAKTIHCYPTQAEALKRIADSYLASRLTPLATGALRRWLAWQRGRDRRAGNRD